MKIPSYDFLTKALNDEDPWVRHYAIDALAELGSPEAKALLLTKLRDKNEWVRLAVLEAIQKLEITEVMDELLISLKDRSVEVRLVAAETLGKFRASKAVEALAESALNRDGFEEDRVREKAIWALGEIGGRRAVEVLIETLGDTNWSIQEKGKQALKRMGVAARPVLEAARIARLEKM